MLMTTIIKHEVHQAFVGMDSYKALGINTFSLFSSRYFWDDIGDVIWMFVIKDWDNIYMDLQVTRYPMV